MESHVQALPSIELPIAPLMPPDKDLDNNRSVMVDRSTIEAMRECNNHKHSFHFNMVTKSKPITLFG